MSYVISTVRGITGAYGWYTLKTLLVSVGWIVKASGDGLSAFSSSSDVITGPGSGANGMGNTSAWFRIRMPAINGITREFVFQMSDTSGDIGALWYSYSAGFTGGSPSSTVLPTATDGQNLGAGSMFSNDAQKWHAGAMNAAPWGFWMHPIVNGNYSGSSIGGVLVDPILPGTGPDLDLDPYIVYLETASGGSWNKNNMTGSRTTCGAWYGKGTVYETWGTANALTYHQPVGGGDLFPGGNGTNNYDFAEQWGPIYWGKVSGSLVVPHGFKGAGTICRWNGTPKASGQLMSDQSTYDRLCVGDVNFPHDGTLVVI